MMTVQLIYGEAILERALAFLTHCLYCLKKVRRARGFRLCVGLTGGRQLTGGVASRRSGLAAVEELSVARRTSAHHERSGAGAAGD